MPRVLAVVLPIVCGGCGPAAPAPAEPAAPPAVAAPIDAMPIDAPDPTASAPAWVFRYHTPDRTETWTLRFADGQARVEVETTRGTQRYAGTATDGATLAIAVATSGGARLALDCKRAERRLSTTCNDRAAKPVAVLDCYHPDFATPMPFAPAPGVEYVADAGCTGYRLIAR